MHFPFRVRAKLFLFLIITVIVAFSGCSYDKWDLPQPSLGDCDTSASVTYTNYVKDVLATNCTVSGCHDNGAPAGFDYTTYAGIKAKADNGTFKTRVIIVGTRDMPPDTVTTSPNHLDDCTLAKLKKWLDSGAPE